ncbi:MAG: glutathione-regulated potassium-efflux system oxidoreductase KefF [Enterobacter kobei]|nr:glutathione-regulated potassium-efflux system oxidoreductase KefF [Enterobacter kobei]
MILIIYAHPYPRHSHANKRMIEHAATLDGVEIRSLYELYPDFDTGGGEHHFELGGHPGFDVLSQPLQSTALYCGLKWLPPFTMHNTFVEDDETLQAQARHYKQRLIDWQETHHG